MSNERNNFKSATLDFSSLLVPHNEASEVLRQCVWNIVRRSDSGADEHRTTVPVNGLSVGRHPQNDLCLVHPTVSGKHAQLYCVEDDLFLKDVGSTNGTLLNGRRLTTLEILHDGDVIHFGQIRVGIERNVQEFASAGQPANKTRVAYVPEDAALYKGFDRLINRPDIDPYFQPLVTLKHVRTVGYEVLVRSRIKGLETPDKIFRIAAMRLCEARLSEVCRAEGLLCGVQLNPDGCYFLNTHATELETPRLIQSLQELRSNYPGMRIVLEVHEAAITSVKYLGELIAALTDLDIELAYDDFGAGQARLVELFQVPPRYLKFDISFVRGLERTTPSHRASVRSLLKMVHDLGVIALAEGVETQEQVDVCTELGFDMAQGYFFGRPQPRQFWQAPQLMEGNATQSLSQLKSDIQAI